MAQAIDEILNSLEKIKLAKDNFWGMTYQLREIFVMQ